jgi:membrane protein YdbS with pleckstrin-like domain
MPNDVKAAVSIITVIVAVVLAYWHGSPIRPEFSTFVVVTAIFMVGAMWIFPEAGVKKKDLKKLK